MKASHAPNLKLPIIMAVLVIVLIGIASYSRLITNVSVGNLTKLKLDEYASSHSTSYLGTTAKNSIIICKTHPTGKQKNHKSITMIAQVYCQEYYKVDNHGYRASGMVAIGNFTLTADKRTVTKLEYIEEPVNYKTIPDLPKSAIEAVLDRDSHDLRRSADAAALKRLHVAEISSESLR